MPRRLISKFLFFVLFSTNALWAQEDPQAILDLPGKPNPRLGLAFPGSQVSYYSKLAKAGLAVVRIEASWARIEPRPGNFNFKGMDTKIKGLQRYGLAPFVTFASDAKWATMAGTHHLKNATPSDLSRWSKFVAAVVERYDHDGVADMPGLRAPVRYYQAANEFMGENNSNGGWAGSNEQLLDYVNEAHDAVKAADRRAIFVLGGLSAFSIDAALLASGANITLQDERRKGEIRQYKRSDFAEHGWDDLFQNRLKRLLGRAKYDFADIHLYGPEARDAARIALAKRLAGRPVLSSECGGPSLHYGGRYSGHNHFVAAIERNLNVLAAGMPFCLWFGLGEEIKATYGNSRVPLYDKSRRAKPGETAYRLLSRLLTKGATITQTSGERLFQIRHNGTSSTHVALGRPAQNALVKRMGKGSSAICVNDAAARDVVVVPLSEASGVCSADAVVITGAVALSLMRNE